MNNKILLKDLCIEDNWGKYGIPASAEDFDVSKMRYLRITDISDVGELLNHDKKSVSTSDIDKYVLNEGDIVFARTGNSTGRTYYHEDKKGKLAFAGFLIKYALDPQKINPKYLKFYTISTEYKKWVKNLSVGSTRGNINAQTFANCPITVPDRKQQDLLVDTLSLLIDKIEINNRIISELEAMATSLYDYWFVQFDFPNTKGKPYKNSGGKMIWSEQLKAEVPYGWEVEKMSKWINIDKSGDWGKEEPEGNFTTRVTCIRGADINGLNGLGELKPPTRYILKKNYFKVLRSHDIVIEISGGSPTQSTGRLAFITDATIKRFENPLICSNFCKPISLKNKKLLYNFVYYWKRLYDNGIFFDYEGKTSGIKNLLLDSFVTSYYTVIPNDKIVNQFYQFMENIQERRQKALAENQKLSELRDWLLPMLMNGQVSIGKLSKSLEQTLRVGSEENAKFEKTAQLSIPQNKKIFAKQVLAGRIVSLFKKDKNFTHIKFQKLQFLAEYIGEVDLNLNYYFQTAGPYDNVFMHTIFESFKKLKWFDEKHYTFVELEKQSQIEGYYYEYFKPISNRLEKLFSLLINSTEAETEIIATIYAVWNNRIILKQNFSEETLVEDFYNWSGRKHKYAKTQVLAAIKWLTQNDFAPNGFGKEIKRAKNNLK
jgi:type I restriction enzyme S subunit